MHNNTCEPQDSIYKPVNSTFFIFVQLLLYRKVGNCLWMSDRHVKPCRGLSPQLTNLANAVVWNCLAACVALDTEHGNMRALTMSPLCGVHFANKQSYSGAWQSGEGNPTVSQHLPRCECGINTLYDKMAVYAEIYYHLGNLYRCPSSHFALGSQIVQISSVIVNLRPFYCIKHINFMVIGIV